MYIILMNAVMFALSVLLGGDYEFNYIFNIVVPIICAGTSLEVERRKARRAVRY
ncbi:MAG: hypothetical protein IJH48_03015 [Oscillospiraceae bacterium]|nr:hypothetical protein [Oscillospiraceae bacterium]